MMTILKSINTRTTSSPFVENASSSRKLNLLLPSKTMIARVKIAMLTRNVGGNWKIASSRKLVLPIAIPAATKNKMLLVLSFDARIDAKIPTSKITAIPVK